MPFHSYAVIGRGIGSRLRDNLSESFHGNRDFSAFERSPKDTIESGGGNGWAACEWTTMRFSGDSWEPGD